MHKDFDVEKKYVINEFINNCYTINELTDYFSDTRKIKNNEDPLLIREYEFDILILTLNIEKDEVKIEDNFADDSFTCIVSVNEFESFLKRIEESECRSRLTFWWD